jgi:hypothetical protein
MANVQLLFSDIQTIDDKSNEIQFCNRMIPKKQSHKKNHLS